MWLICALVLGCGDKEDTGGPAADGGAAEDGGSAADGGAQATGYGPDCADSVVVYDPCDCTAVAVGWEDPIAAMELAEVTPGEVTIAFTDMSGEDFALAACAGTLGQDELSGIEVLDAAAADQALVDFSGRVGQSVGVFVADTDGTTWGYLFGEIAAEGEDYRLDVPAVD